MKILFLFKYHQGQIEHIEAQAKTLPLVTYAERVEFVQQQTSHIFLTLIRHFNKLGHTAELISPNFKFLQEKWAEENNLTLTDDWQLTLPKKQIELFKPDILFLSSNFEYYGDFVKSVRPFVEKVCAWISCPFDESLNLSNLDLIFTLFEPHHNWFKKQNISSTLTRAGFDSDELQNLHKQEQYDVTFVGGIGHFHKTREYYLRKIVKRVPLKIWGYGFTSKNPVKNFIKQVLTGFAFKKAYQGEAWGREMLQILSDSKICLNIHGDISQGHAVNMRMFEVTGAGSLLLTEYSPEISSLFIPDQEIVCYKTVEEAIEKINYYLSHPNERIKIAQAGHERCLRDYDYAQLAKEYITEFELLLKR